MLENMTQKTIDRAKYIYSNQYVKDLFTGL